MTRAQRRQRYNQLHRQQTRDEQYWQPRIEAALTVQMRPFMRHLRQFGVASAAANLNSLVMPEPVASVIERLYIRVGVQNANSEYGWLMDMYSAELKQVKQFGFNEAFAGLMRGFYSLWGGERVQSITETERRRIQKVLEQAAEQSLSPDETARLLRSEVVNASRAKLIAKTEIAASANYGTSIGAKRTGVVIDKVWISTLSDRTRRTPRDQYDHLTMNEIKVADGEMFSVPMKNGGVEMLPYPCHPSGSAANVIRCRCRTVTQARRDERNRIIRIPVV